LYRRFFPILKLQNDYSTKNFPHLALQNSLQLMRTVLAVGNPKNIVRACACEKSALRSSAYVLLYIVGRASER